MYLYCLFFTSGIFGQTCWFSGLWKSTAWKHRGAVTPSIFVSLSLTFSLFPPLEWPKMMIHVERLPLPVPGRRQVHSSGGSWHNWVLNPQYPQIFPFWMGGGCSCCHLARWTACPWSCSEQEMAAEAAWRNWGGRRRYKLKRATWLPRYFTMTQCSTVT